MNLPESSQNNTNETFSAALRPLQAMHCRYAFYLRPAGQPPQLHTNVDPQTGRFRSASIIKIPILLAWVMLERAGQVSRTEICNLDEEPQVQGAGFSWLLHARQLPFQDVLLMMIALSDNLCTNLVIRRLGIERIQRVFQETFGFQGTALQRKLMDYAARDRGLENWITPNDCIRFFDLVRSLTPAELAWVEPMLAANQDDLLFMRSIPRDTITFHHKTGSMTGVLHDWGYTASCDIFLLTQNVPDEPTAFTVFGELGKLLS